jgi:predicted anti-sigma-YlaC factor YlaD
MGQISPNTCNRIHELFSASLDGELAELEEARLQAHLSSCAGCRSYADGAAAAAQLVRTTPLEECSFPIVVPGRRVAVARRLQAVAGVAAVAAVAVAVSLSATVGPLSGPRVTRVHHASVSASLRFPDQELRMLERSSRARSHARLAL